MREAKPVHQRMNRRHACLIGLPLCLIALGCGSESRVERFGLSGQITFEGEPIPFGWLVFKPAHGPGATANIENGTYRTRAGWGTVGGQHSVEIVAFDGKAIPDPMSEGGVNSAGSNLFSITVQKELPRETSTWDLHLTQDDINAAAR